jgi:hypothetical protein
LLLRSRYGILIISTVSVLYIYILDVLIVIALFDYRSLDSAVGIATGYGLDDRVVGVRVAVGSRISSSPRRPDRLWGPPKRQGREADHSSPASAEVKKMWINISTPPYAFME